MSPAQPGALQLMLGLPPCWVGILWPPRYRQGPGTLCSRPLSHCEHSARDRNKGSRRLLPKEVGTVGVPGRAEATALTLGAQSHANASNPPSIVCPTLKPNCYWQWRLSFAEHPSLIGPDLSRLLHFDPVPQQPSRAPNSPGWHPPW